MTSEQKEKLASIGEVVTALIIFLLLCLLMRGGNDAKPENRPGDGSGPGHVRDVAPDDGGTTPGPNK